MKIGNGFKTRLEFVLEQVFGGLSDGGDHETRAYVAARLLEAAQSGILKLEDLRRVAHDALVELLRPSKRGPMQPQLAEQNSASSRLIKPDRQSRHV